MPLLRPNETDEDFSLYNWNWGKSRLYEGISHFPNIGKVIRSAAWTWALSYKNLIAVKIEFFQLEFFRRLLRWLILTSCIKYNVLLDKWQTSRQHFRSTFSMVKVLFLFEHPLHKKNKFVLTFALVLMKISETSWKPLRRHLLLNRF